MTEIGMKNLFVCLHPRRLAFSSTRTKRPSYRSVALHLSIRCSFTSFGSKKLETLPLTTVRQYTLLVMFLQPPSSFRSLLRFPYRRCRLNLRPKAPPSAYDNGGDKTALPTTTTEIIVSECENRLLIHEYMPNGSLGNHLFERGSNVLSWSLRMKIAIGAARELCFLHDSKNEVIYRDFKASNILLDSGFNAKLSDFGLAREGPKDDRSHVITEVIDTKGYANLPSESNRPPYRFTKTREVASH
ncbi:BnaAnng25790D [Brassica napus]|uniref:non-specific serine/threonine protein kinase n=2 Tax=Brassica TaxID=3705 RepID=A0A078JQP6_BRANA|nr:unnamed protein product [Brassica napus]CDY67991.1 BnaAnng25790D [Brassica napus]